MKGLVNHEKRNMWAITFVFTAVVWFIVQAVIASDISSNGSQLNSFYGNFYENYGNLFLGTLNQYYETFIILLMVPISFVAVMQYRENNVSKCGEFFMQLPIKRSRIFATRTIIGMMTYTIPWLFFSVEMIVMRFRAQSWYEMKLAGVKNGALLLGNDSILHLCAYLGFIWLSLTLVYSIAVFFQNICKKPWIGAAIGIGAMVFPMFLTNILPKIGLMPADLQQSWWMVPFFQRGAVSEEFLWDQGVHQTVTFSSFDHFGWILLIQIVLIILLLSVALYVFKKADMAKSNNFIYFSWMEHLFFWIFPCCIALFIIVVGFKVNSLKGGILAVIIATIIDQIIERRKKRRNA